MNLATDRALIPAETPAVRYLTVTITAPEAPRKTERPAVGVSLVLDRSGSMAGRKFEMARKAATHAIRLLSDRDHLAVVVYDDQVDTLLGRTPASGEAKTLAERRLRETDARGSTDLAGGWLRGLEEMTGEGIRRVLLLSDGLANQGETDPDTLAAMASSWRSRGVATTTFGVGADFDEVLMSRLARDGGGNFYFVENPKQIADFFASELGETLDVVAPDAKFEMVYGPGLTAELLNDFVTDEVTRGGLRVRLGDLVSGQVVTLVFAVSIDATAEGQSVVLECRPTDRAGAFAPAAAEHANVKKADKGRMPPMRVEWTAAPTDQDAAQPVNPAVLVAAAELLAARARTEALEANRGRDFARAKAVIAACAQAIRELAGGRPELDRIADELELREDEFSHDMGPIAMKSVAYASSLQRRSRDAEGKARRSEA